MKLRKLISGVAATAVATTALATAASASLIAVESPSVAAKTTISNTSMFLVMLYSDGTFDASDKAVTDYGLDLTQIGSVDVVYKAADPDFFTGEFGGAIVLSSKSSDNQTHNWNSKEYWGVSDEEAEIETVATDKAVVFEKIGDYTYKATMAVDDTNCVFDDTQFVQLAMQDWGVDDMIVVSVDVKDKSGASMISFDDQGEVTLGGAAAPVVEEAPAVEEAPVVTAPAAGDVQAATDSSKGSPDTGIADVAAIAGLAVVAAGAIVVAKKSK